jgi:hypothetical protein
MLHEQEMAFGLGDIAPQFAGGFDPLRDSRSRVFEGLLTGRAVGGTAGEFGDLAQLSLDML